MRKRPSVLTMYRYLFKDFVNPKLDALSSVSECGIWLTGGHLFSEKPPLCDDCFWVQLDSFSSKDTCDISSGNTAYMAALERLVCKHVGAKIAHDLLPNKQRSSVTPEKVPSPVSPQARSLSGVYVRALGSWAHCRDGMGHF